MKALVIGANGFLGRNLTSRLVKDKNEVACIYNKNTKHIPKSCRKYQINEIEKINQKFDTVFVAAGYIPFKNLDFPDLKLLESNVLLLSKILMKFHDSNIVFSSSVTVYGVHKGVILENSSFNNPNLYGLSKIAAEFLIKFHANYQILRFGPLYGVGMHSELFVSKIVENAIIKKTITLLGDGSRIQNYLHVDDAVEYFIRVSGLKKPKTYLAVNDKSYSNKEVAEMVKKLVKGCKIEYSGKDSSPSFIYNNDITTKELGFTPKVSLETGLKDMINYE